MSVEGRIDYGMPHICNPNTLSQSIGWGLPKARYAIIIREPVEKRQVSGIDVCEIGNKCRTVLRHLLQPT